MSIRSITRTACFAAALSLFVPSANAQCVGPDNLSGPCWQPTNVVLPIFPGISLPGAGICWDGCTPLPKDATRVEFTPPTMIKCAEFGSQVTVSTTTGVPVLSGFATLNYTRTWFETNPATGANYQVWRMTAKIDFSETTIAPPACWNPPCLNAPGDTCFWYGYVDWAEECATGGYQNAVVLYHACDDFTHNQFLSANPAPAGGFHPTSYYAVVAPDTPANPFDPTPVVTPRSGPLFGEAMRNVNSINPPNACIKEERIAGGGLDLLGQACLCPISFGDPRQSASRFSGVGSCPDATGLPSSFLSLNLFSPAVGFNWFDMIGTSLGTWTTDLTYPGQEAPVAEEGFFLYHDSCASLFGLAPDTLDIMYGAKTSGGYDANDAAGIVLPTNFVDLCSNYSLPFVSLPMLGKVDTSDHLIYVNVP